MKVFKLIFLLAIAVLVCTCIILAYQGHQNLVLGTSPEYRAAAVDIWRSQTQLLGATAVLALIIGFIVAADFKTLK